MKIVVSIVAYRDFHELVQTVHSLLCNALEPSRVKVYVFSQDTLLSNTLLRAKLSSKKNVVLKTTHYLNARGPMWARQKLLVETILPECDGTEHYLQLDSHMRLVSGWDDALLRNFNNIYGESKKLITHYPPPLSDLRTATRVPVLSGTQSVIIGDTVIKKCVSNRTFTTNQISTGCLQSPHVAAGFFFCTIRDVIQMYPLKRYYEYVFQGEEMLLEFAFREFRKFPPEQNVASHAYGRRSSPKVWDDLPDWKQKNREAIAGLLLDLTETDHL